MPPGPRYLGNMDREKQKAALQLQLEWAEEQTLLAVARTVGNWIRTGLGAIGVALGMHVIFRDPENLMLGRLTASLFLVIAAALFIGGNLQARRLQQKLSQERKLPLRNHYAPLTIVLVLATIATGVLLWIV